MSIHLIYATELNNCAISYSPNIAHKNNLLSSTSTSQHHVAVVVVVVTCSCFNFGQTVGLQSPLGIIKTSNRRSPSRLSHTAQRTHFLSTKKARSGAPRRPPCWLLHIFATFLIQCVCSFGFGFIFVLRPVCDQWMAPTPGLPNRTVYNFHGQLEPLPEHPSPHATFSRKAHVAPVRSLLFPETLSTVHFIRRK